MITTWSVGPSGDGMPEEMLVETLEVVQAHPWWAARARLALSLLRGEGLDPPASVVDVGCGWGAGPAAHWKSTSLSRQLGSIRPDESSS